MAVDELTAQFQREADEQKERAQRAEAMVRRLLDGLDGILGNHPPTNPYLGETMDEARVMLRGET